MDVALTLKRLNEDLSSLIEGGDFEGAEEFLSASLGNHPEYHAFIHFQFGRLYHRWNKLSSAIHHLHHAVDLTIAQGNELYLVSILDELNAVKRRQSDQRP